MYLDLLNNLNQAQRERLAFIEFRLWFLGDLRRPDIIDRFGIAPAVATRDISAYREIAPENIGFDGKRKLYIPTSNFQPIFDHEPDRVLSALSRGFGEGLGKASSGYLLCGFPLRLNQPALPVLSTITRAIHQHSAVRLKYYSLNSGLSERIVVPGALVDSGLRWHARVYDRNSQEFRDLVITRMENPVLLDGVDIDSHEQIDKDIQWNRIVTLELVPHPNQPRPEIVARDFGMKDNRLVLNVRAAIAGYVLQQWNVDCSTEHHLDPTCYRLWLKDSLVLYGVENAILAPGYIKPI
ncbi:MAG: WYL domain-containing protein [Methylococcaceae bacterium]|nr:WYL domain-containing protein [Methylococcaceae bacterium]